MDDTVSCVEEASDGGGDEKCVTFTKVGRVDLTRNGGEDSVTVAKVERVDLTNSQEHADGGSLREHYKARVGAKDGKLSCMDIHDLQRLRRGDGRKEGVAFFTDYYESEITHRKGKQHHTLASVSEKGLVGFVFPVNADGDHWEVVYCDVKTNQIWCFDSLGTSGSRYGKALVNHLSTSNQSSERWTIHVSNVTYQTDDYSCGVWSMLFVDMCVGSGTNPIDLFRCRYEDVPSRAQELAKWREEAVKDLESHYSSML